MSKAFRAAQKILEDKGRNITVEDVEVFTMLVALFDEDEARDVDKMFEGIEQKKIDPSTKLYKELYGQVYVCDRLVSISRILVTAALVYKTPSASSFRG